MPKHIRNVIIFTSTILAITGIFSTLIETEIWKTSTFIRSNIIRLHVSWSVISCIVIGIVLEGHVKKVLKYKNSKKKFLGGLSLTLFFLLLFTSFIIRHIKIPMVHSVAITTHWIVGLFLISIFLLHFFVKKKT
jgi:hypothetical protein